MDEIKVLLCVGGLGLGFFCLIWWLHAVLEKRFERPQVLPPDEQK